MPKFIDSIFEWIKSTQVIEQISEVDAVGLFTNPWFLVPFVLLIGYMVYKQSFRDLAIITIFIGIWWVSGTEYMATLVDGEVLDIKKILPVAFGGAVALGLVIYLLFGRSD